MRSLNIQVTHILGLLDKNTKMVLLIAFLLSVLIRVAYVVVTYDTFVLDIEADEAAYLGAGKSFLQGDFNPSLTFNKKTFENLIIGPGLPLVVTVFEFLFNNPNLAFVIYNILLSSILVIVLYKLGKYLFNNSVAWLITLYGVFFYETIRFSPHIYKECTIIFLLPLIIVLLLKSFRSSKPLLYIFLAILLFSFLIHIDERFIVYLPLLLLLIFLNRNLIFRTRLLNAALALTFLVLTMLPWSIHLYQVHDQFVILTPRTTVITSKIWGSDISGMKGQSDETIGEKEKYNPWPNLTKRIIEEKGIIPEEWGKWEARWKSFVQFWQPMFIKGQFTAWGFRWVQFPMYKNIINLLMYGLFIPFYIISLVLLIKRKYYVAIVIWSIPFIHSLVHAYLIWGRDRYRAQTEIFVILFALYAMHEIFKYFNKNRSIEQSDGQSEVRTS